jgi:hypothetical protein
MNTIAGSRSRANVNNTFTSFSASPAHFDVNEDAEIEKKDAPDSEATAFPIRVLPVPGGPKKRIPRGNLLNPVNKSGFKIGRTTAS